MRLLFFNTSLSISFTIFSSTYCFCIDISDISCIIPVIVLARSGASESVSIILFIEEVKSPQVLEFLRLGLNSEFCFEDF
jgi:hypothetical protein